MRLGLPPSWPIIMGPNPRKMVLSANENLVLALPKGRILKELTPLMRYRHFQPLLAAAGRAGGRLRRRLRRVRV